MSFKLIARLVLIFILIMILFIAQSMIRGVIYERQSLQQQVENTIAESSAGEQRITGPILVVPYVERVETKFVNDKGKTIVNVKEEKQERIFMPKAVNINGVTDVETRYKGIYKAMTYRLNALLDAEFEIPANLDLTAAPSAITVGEAYVVLGIADVRGLVRAPEFSWNERALTVDNGTFSKLIPNGVHIGIGKLDVRETVRHQAKMKLPMIGMRSLAFVPLARNTVVNLKSSWPHPNFGGRFLPASKTISENGFEARWEVSQLATKNANALLNTSESRDMLEAFNVAFIEPVNVYQQVERASKYGLLFIGLTFAAVFLFESLKRLQVHPIQYAFVGFALSLFFLLLLSLSEHIRFAYAYASASVACVALIGYYLAFVLKSKMRGLVFGTQLAVLYGVLYGLLLSEDNALVMGSVLIFVLLAAAMIATRHVDWYQLWKSDPKPSQPPHQPTKPFTPHTEAA
jgi:inner membrane protein